MPTSIEQLLIRNCSPCLRRTFSSSIRQHVAKKTKPIPRPAKYTHKPVKAPASPAYKPFAQTLADRSEPVLLYQGASTTVYKAGCYTLGLLCFVWSVHSTRQMWYYPPPYFNRFLKGMYYGVCGLAIAMSAFFIMRPYRIIETINTLPVTSKKGTRTLHLQLVSSPLFPGIRPRTVSVPADYVVLSAPLASEKSGGVPLRLLELRHKRAEKARNLREGSLISLPLRQLRFHLGNAWQALKGAFTNSAFIYLRAKGHYASWKVAEEAGWALDEGRALDRIVRSKVTA
ncbi:MAG: hypothetical protein L6R39_000066 [Caloplaca ligustica]|nr:MAG: hypothetical protein L6R39_000066 [Caloplaca ligustica]